jgi:ribosomal protein L11 methyltransferase
VAQAQQIIARGARADIETASAALDADPALEGATHSLIEEDEARGAWRIDAYPATEAEAGAFLAALNGRAGLRVEARALADADWIALALSGLPPVIAGRFFVYGAHDLGRVPANAIALRIEAGAAFGTGHHGTTVGCLMAFDALLKRRRFARVADVGTGTGLLAIAAAASGARHVFGTDIDPVSVRVARENAAINGVNCVFRSHDPRSHRQLRRPHEQELVFANILAGPLIALAEEIRRALRPGGVIILSGLLRGQARRVRAAYLAHGFQLRRRLDVDAWTTLVMERRR